MQLRLVSIDIDQPGVAALLGFQVLDHRGEVIGKATVHYGDPALHDFRQDVAVGSRWKLLELEEPSQPAVYPDGAPAAPMGPNVGPGGEMRSCDARAAGALDAQREPTAAPPTIRLVHITADGAGVGAVLDQLPSLLAEGEPA